MNYAPSVYEYRSVMEWEQAMNEWLSENEPKFKLNRYDARTDTYTPVFRSDLDLFPKIEFGIKSVKRYAAPGTIPFGGCKDHLDGGSRADYRMAGYRRY